MLICLLVHTLLYRLPGLRVFCDISLPCKYVLPVTEEYTKYSITYHQFLNCPTKDDMFTLTISPYFETKTVSCFHVPKIRKSVRLHFSSYNFVLLSVSFRLIASKSELKCYVVTATCLKPTLLIFLISPFQISSGLVQPNIMLFWKWFDIINECQLYDSVVDFVVWCGRWVGKILITVAASTVTLSPEPSVKMWMISHKITMDPHMFCIFEYHNHHVKKALHEKQDHKIAV